MATADRRTLIQVFAINALFFVAELLAGWWAQSMGLLADGLDMLADAIVYGLSISAIGQVAARKRRIAHLSGYFQLALAAIGFAEVLRRALLSGTPPEPLMMALVSVFALAGNLACLYLLRRAKDGEAHMQASWIFTSNDAKANVGVILAAGSVALLDSSWPDLAIGAIIFVMVIRGAMRILRL
jgi:Co/Zn/Cd efflux system component